MDVMPDRLWQHLVTLCEEIGPRLAGTPGGEKAREYIEGHFRRCGLHVEAQDFPCPAWEHEETELRLSSNGSWERLPAFAQTFTEACDVEAELACVATRHELKFGPDLEGKVLLLYGEVGTGLALNRNHTLLEAEDRRPAALLVLSTDEEVSTKLIRDPFLRVPAAAVPRSAGMRLRESSGKTVRLRIRARRYDSVGRNIRGRLPGEGGGRIVVAAHFDSAAESPGATDNASGTALVLELAEVLAAEQGSGLGVDFIAYDAEEYGRHAGGNLGAVEYVRRHPAEVRQAKALVEADCVGTVLSAPIVHLSGWPTGAREDIVAVLRRFPRYVIDDSPETMAKHTAFHLPGVPALWFVDDYPKLPIHTAQDTIELVDRDGLVFAAEVAAAATRHLRTSGWL